MHHLARSETKVTDCQRRTGYNEVKMSVKSGYKQALGISLITLSGLLAIVTGTALLVSCQPAMESQAEVLPEGGCSVPETFPEEGITDMAKSDAYSTTIPPIDASAPAKTETATFALG